MVLGRHRVFEPKEPAALEASGHGKDLVRPVAPMRVESEVDARAHRRAKRLAEGDHPVDVS